MRAKIRRAIFICALGYFIDIFDIQLFAVLRVPSLTDMGVTPDQLSIIGGYILNAQMAGMIAGAFLWGWLGDRLGRIKALYGSILIYSIGTLACSFINDPIAYGICRFITGFGLAGETGTAVTLVSELMSPAKRAWGVTIVGGIGAFGPFFAILLSYVLDWRSTYIMAGLMGLGLLVLRLNMTEPAVFQKVHQTESMRGSLRLFLQKRTARVFLYCLAIGIPVTYAVNLLNFYSLEISHYILKPGETFSQKTCMLLFYVGIGMGNVACGTVSQLWQSRRKTFITFLSIGAVMTGIYLLACPVVKITAEGMYIFNFLLGVTLTDLVLVTLITAEQFGTDIRATSTALVTNALRACVIPMVFTLQLLNGVVGLTAACAIIGAFMYVATFWSILHLKETHGVELDYIENARHAPGTQPAQAKSRRRAF